MILDRRHQIRRIDRDPRHWIAGACWIHLPAFWSEAQGVVTPSAVAVLAAGVFLLLWPIRLSARH